MLEFDASSVFEPKNSRKKLQSISNSHKMIVRASGTRLQNIFWKKISETLFTLSFIVLYQQSNETKVKARFFLLRLILRRIFRIENDLKEHF